MLADLTPGAVGIWLGLGMLAVHFSREWRENRKLSTEDREALRTGYAADVTALREENRKLADDLRQLREDYSRYRRECETENEELRAELIRLRYEIAGLRAAFPSIRDKLPEAQVVQLVKLDRKEKP